jgi:hypothetical protein
MKMDKGVVVKNITNKYTQRNRKETLSIFHIRLWVQPETQFSELFNFTWNEANSHPASQEILCLLWNPKVHYCVHECLTIPRPRVTFRNELFLQWGVASSSTNLHAREPPIVGCPWQLIQYSRSYPSHPEAVSSIRHSRMHHVVMTGTHNIWPSLSWNA